MAIKYEQPKYPKPLITGIEFDTQGIYTLYGEPLLGPAMVKATIYATPAITFNTSTCLTTDERRDFDALCERVGQRIIDEFAATLGKTP